MVQDNSKSPEMYLAVNDGKCAGWGLEDDDTTLQDVVVDVNILGERHLVWAVSIPGLSAWCFGGDTIVDNNRGKTFGRTPLLPTNVCSCR